MIQIDVAFVYPHFVASDSDNTVIIAQIVHYLNILGDEYAYMQI